MNNDKLIKSLTANFSGVHMYMYIIIFGELNTLILTWKTLTWLWGLGKNTSKGGMNSLGAKLEF